MTSEDIAPDQVRDIFVRTLAPGTTHIAAFPDPLPLGIRIALAAPEGSSRERIRVRAEHDETGYYLDFYQERNDGETSSHYRIREDGSIMHLENLIQVHQHFADPEQNRHEQERIVAHNKRVIAILKAKDFYM